MVPINELGNVINPKLYDDTLPGILPSGELSPLKHISIRHITTTREGREYNLLENHESFAIIIQTDYFDTLGRQSKNNISAYLYTLGTLKANALIGDDYGKFSDRLVKFLMTEDPPNNYLARYLKEAQTKLKS